MRMADCIIARTVGFEKYPIPCKELKYRVVLHGRRHGHSWLLPWSGIEPWFVKPPRGGYKQQVSQRNNWVIHHSWNQYYMYSTVFIWSKPLVHYISSPVNSCTCRILVIVLILSIWLSHKLSLIESIAITKLHVQTT